MGLKLQSPGVIGYQNDNWRRATRAASCWYSNVPTHANMEKQAMLQLASGLKHDLDILFRYVTGDANCEVKAATENELQCVMQSEERTHIVTNQGSHRSRFNF